MLCALAIVDKLLSRSLHDSICSVRLCKSINIGLVMMLDMNQQKVPSRANDTNPTIKQSGIQAVYMQEEQDTSFVNHSILSMRTY